MEWSRWLFSFQLKLLKTRWRHGNLFNAFTKDLSLYFHPTRSEFTQDSSLQKKAATLAGWSFSDDELCKAQMAGIWIQVHEHLPLFSYENRIWMVYPSYYKSY